MKKKSIIGMMASAMMAVSGFGNSPDLMKPELKNDKHLLDLETRLQNIANNAKAKGQRTSIGSTMPYTVIADRSRKQQQKIQFAGQVNENGLHQFYLKDGEWVQRF